MAVYREFELADLEVEYDIAATVASVDDYLAEYGERSNRTMEVVAGQLDIAYGPEPAQKLDAFPTATENAAIHIYIHGGYWLRGDKAGCRFPAKLFTDAGAVWVPVNYRLADVASLDEIVADVRAAIAWVHGNAASIGGDAERIYVTGNSAGGHLTGMLMAAGWQQALGLPGDVVKGGAAVSGLHDLAPFLHTSQKEYLNLDEDAQRRNSPMQNLPRQDAKLLVAWGGRETAEFERQSMDYAGACAAAGVDVDTLCLDARNHFELIGELDDPQSPLTRAILELMDLA